MEIERIVRRFNRYVYPIFAALVVAAATGMHACTARGQSPSPNGGAAPTFEVATVKPDPNDSGTVNFQVAPGRFRADNATVHDLVGLAYNVKTNDGIEGAPKWAGSDKFDVDAKIGDAEVATIQKLQPSQRLEQYRLMVRSLLAERFALITSTRIKQLPVYALVVAKNGPKLTRLEPREQHMPMLWGGSRGELHAKSVSMATFADWISGNPDTDGRAVIDRTGLTGSYDFTLKWTRVGANVMSGPGTSPPASSTIAIDQAGPSFFTALQEQLGLKLEPAKGPVQVLVIQHVEKPSPN